VLDEACRQLRALRDRGLGDLRMAVNLSGHQLRQGSLATRLQWLAKAYGFRPGDLELEITESVTMESPDTTVAMLREFRTLGVELAIDDFGTGYSSLSRLKLLPIQRIKLDRSFVRDIETDPNDAAICKATIALAHSLGLELGSRPGQPPDAPLPQATGPRPARSPRRGWPAASRAAAPGPAGPDRPGAPPGATWHGW